MPRWIRSAYPLLFGLSTAYIAVAQDAQLSSGPVIHGRALFLESSQYSWEQWQYGPGPRPRTPSPLEKKALQTSRNLQARVNHVKFEDQPLIDVVNEFFKTQHGLDLEVDWAALALAHLPKDHAVSMELSNATIEEVLLEMLDRLSEEKDTAFSFYVLDGEVKVSTENDFDNLILTRVYDITWLGTGVPHYLDAPEITLDWRRADVYTWQRMQDAQLPYIAGTTRDPELNFRELRDELIHVLIDLRPTSWEVHGGPGSITMFGTKLVIDQTPEMHVLIGGKWW